MIVLLLACGGPQPGTSPVGTLPTPLTGDTANYSAGLGVDPDFSQPSSSFNVSLGFGNGSFYGAFRDIPALVHHQESDREGNCRLVTYTTPMCVGGCTGNDVCIDDTCVANPVEEARGSIEWTYPGGSMTVTPQPTYYTTQTDMVSGEGESSMSFESTTLVVPHAPSITQPSDWNAAFSERSQGEDVELTWSDPYEGMRVRLLMTDCTGSHGGLADANIECEAPDTGSLVIPGDFIDTLIEGNWARGECGSHGLVRYHTATPDGDDQIRFTSSSYNSFFWRPE